MKNELGKKIVMKSPITGKEMLLKHERKVLPFRKESFEIVYQYYYCEDSGERFEDEQLMELNLNQVYDQYRVKHNIPFPEEVREIRHQYGLSGTKMSMVLGFGTNQYRDYEKGDIPSLSNARLIQLVKNPDEFIRLVQLSTQLDEREKERSISNAKRQLLHLEAQKVDIEQHLWGDLRADAFTGFRRPDLYRFFEVIRFFARKTSPRKVKMNKLLFYADFLHFKRYGHSITGARYIAIQMGPVPDNFDGLFNEARLQGYITIQYEQFDNGNIGEQFVPGKKAADLSLEKEELETLELVSSTFEDMNTSDMIQISHEERAWIENEAENSRIDYRYSFDLKGIEFKIDRENQ